MIDEKTIEAIEAVLSKGDTVQVVPGPGGTLKVIHVKREIIYDTKKNKILGKTS